VGVGVPVRLTAGYQLRPRWALQASATYSSYRSSYNLTSAFIDAGGTTYPFQLDGTTRAARLALLGRYTLSRQPTRRVQVYALGGLTFERGVYANQHTLNFIGVSPFPADPGLRRNTLYTRNLLLGVGPGVSCRLVGPLAAQLEMVLGGYLSTNLPFPPGMVGNASPGVRYRFGVE